MTFLLTSEVCALLRVSRQRMYVLMKERKFPKPLKFGNHNRWVEAEVMAWIADRAEARHG